MNPSRSTTSGEEKMDFDAFDTRHYRTVSVREGYRAWAPTYEASVPPEMDLRLLERLEAPTWGQIEVLDLACGTGRIGAWLRERGALAVDGVDLTDAMLAQARDRGIYRALHLADIRETGLASASYDQVVEVLADEHLPSLNPLYAEVARVLRPGGAFWLVGFHPHMLMRGVPTHFDDAATGEPTAIEAHVHLFADHVRAAHAAGLTLVALEEGVVDAAWLARKPQWAKLEHHPVSFAWHWHKP